MTIPSSRLPPPLSLSLSLLPPQSDFYNEAEQNASLDALRSALSEQSPTPTTQLAGVDALKSASADLGGVYDAIDSIVRPIQFGNILTEADRAVEAFK